MKPLQLPVVINFLFVSSLLFACTSKSKYPILNQQQLATRYFNEDAQWYLDNIPFFECSDSIMEQVYYYRWKMYKAHIRNTGQNSYVITEFINHVPWDRDPFCTINAASMHHIYEGRWLKDDRFMDGYINNLFQQGGNNRRYSESVADAAYARFLVNGDTAFLVSQLDSMRSIYNQWNDHWEARKNLYYIPAMPDATEYTIASIDASGGTGGFDGGDAFRPTLNSYMYGNAMAIAKIAAIKGDDAISKEYLTKAQSLKNTIEQELWNDSLEHFCDRFKQDNQYVHYWDFIRGRELAGMAPWYFNLPADNKKFVAAWKHVIDTQYLLGPYGFRTNEPSYEYYFKQIVFFEGQPGSQWNGPSWPYQSSQTLTGMANLLNNYDQQVVSKDDYVKLLRLYAKQHYLPNGKINLVENYHPNKGGPIVYYYWSNHYNHSTFNNLIISGLCGIRPTESDTLEINPLVDGSIKYFCLDDVRYRGHKLTVVYDEDGTEYNLGKGVTVFIDGKKADLIKRNGKNSVVIKDMVKTKRQEQPANYALNIEKKGYPIPSASINTSMDTALFQAVDGRVWYFPEITNRWTTLGSTSHNDWFAIDFGKPQTISSVKLYLVADGDKLVVPDSITIEFTNGYNWFTTKMNDKNPKKFVGNTVNTFQFEKINTTAIRINFKHNEKAIAVSEIECY